MHSMVFDTRLLILFVLVSLGGMLTGCRRDTPEQVAPIRLGIESDLSCALPCIAAQKGYFKQAGLSVKIVPYPSGKLALNAMFAGDVDVAASADVPIMSRSFHHDDFAVFATISWTERGVWIIARKDHGIAGPKDLRGKRVATQKNSAVHFFLSAFLARHGIAEDNVDLLFMPAVELPDALVEGRIDAFSMRNPFIAEAKGKLGDSAIEMFDEDIYRKTFNLVTWKRALDADLQRFERLLEALTEAETLLLRNRQAAQEAVIRQLGSDRAPQIRKDWDKFTFVVTLDQALFVTLEDQARWAMAQNPSLGKTVPNYLPMIDTRPMAQAKPAAMNIIR